MLYVLKKVLNLFQYLFIYYDKFEDNFLFENPYIDQRF